MIEQYYTTINVDTWATARRLQLHMSIVDNWAFRGQSDSQWELQTTFERYSNKYKSFYRQLHKNCSDREKIIIQDFQKRAYSYINNVPGLNNQIEWLSLLQHYGCPTRLLDFSYSFYIAAFFAMEESINDCAIWAVDLDILETHLNDVSDAFEGTSFYDDDEFFDVNKFSKYILNTNYHENLVCYASPFNMHERLSIQQGLFLFPCNLSSSFVKNLIRTFQGVTFLNKPNIYNIGFTDEIDSLIFKEWPLIKIVIPHDSINSALYDLKSMNITAATLFPGLDGFSRSLKLHFRTNIFDGEFERTIAK